MNVSGGPESPAALAATEPLLRLLRDLIHERTGLFYEQDRLREMVDKLEPRVRARSLTSLLDYYYLLRYDEHGPEEWRRLMDAFSVQETYFWREFDQIRVLVDVIVPAWFRTSPRPLRIWSAACATGEEPYSIALALQESGWGRHPIEIVATDASEAALARAEAATYRDRSFRVLPRDLRRRYFEATPGGERLRRELIHPITFRWANLVDAQSYPDIQPVDVIFCRNVFIYFSPDAIRRVARQFAPLVPPAGHLFVGASESLLRLTHDFELQQINGAFAYVRRTAT